MYIARYYRRLQEVFDHTMRTKAIDPSLSTDQFKTEVSKGSACKIRASGNADLISVDVQQVPAQSATFEPEIDPLAFEQFW